MLITLKTLLSIRTSTITNVFLYYLQKLPFVGKHISDRVYADISMKKIVAIIALIITICWSFLLRFAYVGLVIYLPILLVGRGLSTEDQLQHFIHIFVVLSFIISGIGSATILEPKREKYVAVKLMRLSPTTYMLASLSYRYVTFFLYLLPAMLVFTSILGFSIVGGFILTLSVTLWRIFTEYVHLKYFEKTEIVLIKKTAFVWTIIFIGFVVAFAPLFINLVPFTASIVIHLFAFIFFSMTGVFAIVKLTRYSAYRSVVDAATKIDDPLLNIGKMMNDAQKNSVESKESDYAFHNNDHTKFHAKQGYHYINAIFLSRHRNLVRKPIYINVAIIGIITLVGLGIVFAFPEHKGQITTVLSTINPILFAVMYFLTVGEKICRAMFYNCDTSLLRYSFYRNSVFQHFCIRLVHIIKVNLIVATALAAGLTIITIAAGGEAWTIEIWLLWASVMLLSVFFSVHHLFLYYIFQPYATEFNMKNPIYFLINMLVSAISGLSLFMRASSVVFTSIVFIVTMAYACLALILVKRYGMRTFRIK